ncbi:MAG: gfo/Idh/MocA family oxidoreductase, partial [Oscillospiraceae bacterium]
PEICTDYHEILNRAEIDGVIIATSWNEHIQISIDAMKAGKYTGFEVGGTSSLEQCWSMVKTYEETKTPCMMLENCCYGRRELAVLRMIREGLFGELVHCEGSYEHDLRVDIVNGLENKDQRTQHNLRRNAELYPTHELGPIAKYLDINRGNRLLTLTSTASKARGFNSVAEGKYGLTGGPYHQFACGDVITTVIKCARGETIALTHNISLPRPYSRGNGVHGTKGIWMELNDSVYFEKEFVNQVNMDGEPWEKMEDYLEQYDHPIWKDYLKQDLHDAHGGIDYLVLKAFIHSIKNQTNTPIDIYDAASWMAITCLSEQSISMGSMPVAIPDFTNGKWVYREAPTSGKYSLDE